MVATYTVCPCQRELALTMVRSVLYGRSTTAACDFCRQSRCAQSHIPSSFRLCVLCAHAAAPPAASAAPMLEPPVFGKWTYATCH